MRAVPRSVRSIAGRDSLVNPARPQVMHPAPCVRLMPLLLLSLAYATAALLVTTEYRTVGGVAGPLVVVNTVKVGGSCANGLGPLGPPPPLQANARAPPLPSSSLPASLPSSGRSPSMLRSWNCGWVTAACGGARCWRWMATALWCRCLRARRASTTRAPRWSSLGRWVCLAAREEQGTEGTTNQQRHS